MGSVNNDMNATEWNKAVDKWLQEQTLQTNEERIAQWPPDMFALRGGIEEKTVTPDMISGYAAAIGDPNPLWVDQDYSKNTRWGGIIAPPTFENSIGFPYDFREIYKLPGYITILDAATSREYFAVIRPLDEFTATDIFLGMEELPERREKYRSFLQKIERTYFNQRHEKVAVVCHETLIVVDAPGSRYSYLQERYGKIKRPAYSPEELEVIYRENDEILEGKSRCGSETLYWEDVSEGQEIHPLLFGIHQDPDSLFVFKTGHTHSFAIKWAVNKQDMARSEIDPETGEYRSFIDRYFSDHVARLMGFPYAVSVPMLGEACLSFAVTNWMGDDAYITRLDSKQESLVFLGETTRARGKVAGKYISGDEHLVDLEVWSECQDGRLAVKGTATVRLISRQEKWLGGGKNERMPSPKDAILTGGL
ncbi:MaoC family dehydratase N-terminal domain-containing protein [Chloroflexota bacterium]